MEVGFDVNTRTTTLILYIKKGTATFFSVYAHTLYANSQIKNIFYDKLNHIVTKLPKHYQLIFLEGADHDSWTPCLEQIGFGKMSYNVLRKISA